MENKKSYYENDSQNMQDFNPRFSDLYQEYSDSQHDNHTFNLNGTIYVHNHHGGDPIPVGRVKSPVNSKSTARPNNSKPQRERNGAESAGVNRPGASTAAVQRGNTAGSIRPKANPPAQERTGTSWGQAERNEWNQIKRMKAKKAARGFIVGALVLFLFSAILPVVAALMDFDGDNDFSEEDGYEDLDESQGILERESQPLPQPITEEGVVYLMGGFIRIGATADTLLENYERMDFEPQQLIQPGENYYITLDKGDKYGVGSITLKNMGNKATKDLNDFTITDVSADCYTEWGENFVSTWTETDCEIIGGITIGMDYTKALWALAEVCDNPDILNSSEGDQGHLLGYSEKYYYSITITDDEVSRIAVTLRETETEQ